jgi:hypothetical protein
VEKRWKKTVKNSKEGIVFLVFAVFFYFFAFAHCSVCLWVEKSCGKECQKQFKIAVEINFPLLPIFEFPHR